MLLIKKGGPLITNMKTVEDSHVVVGNSKPRKFIIWVTKAMQKFGTNRSVIKEPAPKKYILWVTTKCANGGYSQRWYGWSDNLILTHEEARIKKDKIQMLFDEVEIVELELSQTANGI